MLKNALAILIVALFVFSACGSQDTPRPEAEDTHSTTAAKTEAAATEAVEAATTEAAQDEELVLTLEELSQYNGKDGNPAYIAVEGIIYDVSSSNLWRNGGHNGYEAGQDLTDAILNKSPHGKSTLDRVPEIGRLAE